MRSGTRPDSNSRFQKRFEKPAKWWPVREERIPGLMPTNSTRIPGLMRSVRGGRSGGSSAGTNDLPSSMRYAPAMRAIAMAIALLAGAGTLTGQSSSSETDAVLKTVQTFFHTMSLRDGKPDVRAFSNEEYFAILQASKQKMRERIWNPEVTVHGLIATLRAPYDFWIDGKLSHCGVDAFDLIKTEEGWKIAGGVYTVENDCAPSPLGPLKQQ